MYDTHMPNVDICVVRMSIKKKGRREYMYRWDSSASYRCQKVEGFIPDSPDHLLLAPKSISIERR